MRRLTTKDFIQKTGDFVINKMSQSLSSKKQVISWDSLENRTYTLSSCKDLNSGSWSNIAELAGTGQTMSYTNDNSDGFEVYKLGMRLN